MTIWIDAQLSPAIASWISDNFDIQAFAVRDIGLRDAEDIEIFQAAKQANVVVMTKDRDFVDLLEPTGRTAESDLDNLRQHFKRPPQRNFDSKSFRRVRYFGK